MRRYVVENARYWLAEFRFDGLRLDATHALVDASPTHVLAELAEAVASLSPKRLLVAEDERNEQTLVTRIGSRRVVGGRLPPRHARNTHR